MIKKIIISLIFLTFVLAISGCKPSVEDTTKSVQSSMQSKFDSDDDFSKYHMIVDSVSLIRESDNKFTGIAYIKYKGKEHELPIKVIADNKQIMWETENFAFAFLALDALKGLTNEPMESLDDTMPSNDEGADTDKGESDVIR